MAEWHQSPDYIVDNWTDELLDLMVKKLVERKQQKPKPASLTVGPEDSQVSEESIFARAKNLIKWVKK